MTRYNYYDYKDKKDFPKDINKMPKDYAVKLSDKYGITDVDELFATAEKDHLFGDLHSIDPSTKRLIASFEFHCGVCKKFKLIRWSSDSNSFFMQTVFNPNVSFKKVRKDN